MSVVAISADEQADSVVLASKIGDRVPLLADEDLTVASAWGVAMKGRDIAVPATFLVRRDGTIAYRYIGESMTDRPSVDQLLARARGL